MIPTITLRNNDNCPCLRKGCICGTSHEVETTTVYDLDKEVSIFREQIQKATKEIQDFRSMHKISGISGETPTKQMETTVRVLDEDTKSIIDSGADINYVNKEWCSRKGIHYKVTGYGKIKAYNETFVEDYVRKTTFEFELDGKKQRQIFHVLTDTGKDEMVLGMPWLESENPVIDWKERTVVIPKKSRTSLSNRPGSDERTLVLRYGTSKTDLRRNSAQEKGVPILASIREESPDLRQVGRATLERKNRTHPDEEGKRHEEELKEIRKILPERLWEYQEVFSSTK